MIHDPEHAWYRYAAEQLEARCSNGRAHSLMRYCLVHYQAITMYKSRDTSPSHVILNMLTGYCRFCSFMELAHSPAAQCGCGIVFL